MAKIDYNESSDGVYEEWRPLVGYFGIYEVSSIGRIRSLDRIVQMVGSNAAFSSKFVKGRVLSQAIVKGYPKVTLCKNGHSRQVGVHRLVCETFHGPAPEGCTDVAHNDGNPHNANASNLRWTTRAENMADCRIHGTYTFGEKHHSAILTDQDVIAIRESSEPAKQIAPRYGVHPNYIYEIRNLRRRA